MSPRVLDKWPRAFRGACVPGSLRKLVEDFRVTERRFEELTGEGEHLYLRIEKRNLTTTFVQRCLAEHFSVPAMDVSYAGLKDKRAIATQWFSVRMPGVVEKPAPCSDGFRVLECQRHATKLRPGNLAGNEFELVVRGIGGGCLQTALAHLRDSGFPNYFGPQRFGNDGANITNARAWVDEKRPRIARLKRSMYISAMRSALFNDVLAERVRDATWNRTIEGDCMLEGVATGPLWGRGRLPTSAAAHDLEMRVTGGRPEIRDALEWVGLSQARRPLVERVRDLEADVEGGDLTLRFWLPPGTYANVALGSVFDLTELSE